MLISRSLISGGLGGFWILVGHSLGYETAGMIIGLVAAAFLFVWTHPRWVKFNA